MQGLNLAWGRPGWVGKQAGDPGWGCRPRASQPPARQAQGPARRGAAPSRSRSSRGDRNNSAGGGESNSGPGAGMTPPPRGAAGLAPAPPPSAFESGHPPPPLPPAATSCTNPLGPSCKSNAPSRPHATCAAANGYAVPPRPPRGPGEQQSGGGATRRARLALPPPDSSGNCGSPLSQEAIRRAGRRASNKQTPAAAATREQGRRRAAATPRRGLCAGLRRGDGAGPPPRGPGASGTVRRHTGSDKEPPWGRRPAPSLRPPPLACTGGRAAKVGPGANQHLPTCRVGSCPGVPSPFPRRPRAPGHLLPVGGEPGCYLNARGS